MNIDGFLEYKYLFHIYCVLFMKPYICAIF